MAKEERFVKTYSQGKMFPFEVWVDRETGVNYMYRTNGYGGNFFPLIDKDGNPLVTNPNDLDRYNY